MKRKDSAGADKAREEEAKRLLPKVSVVVPVYNAELYLAQALDSLVNQTLREIEIITVNDGSTDGSRKILEEYAQRDKRVVVIDQANAGVGRAINAGIDAAQGEYLAHMDSDDYISLRMLEDLYGIAKKHDLDLAISNFYKFSGSYETFKSTEFRFHVNPYFYNRVFAPDDFLNKDSNYLVGFAWCQTWSTLYRREFLDEHGIRWNEKVRAYNDLGFWFQTRSLAKRLMYVDRAYYFYRQDNVNSTINNLNKMFPDRIAESKYVEGKLKEKGIYKKFKDLYYDSKIKAYLDFVLPRIAFELKYEFVERISEEFSGYFAAGELNLDAFAPKYRSAVEGLLHDSAAWFADYVRDRYRVSVILPVTDEVFELRKALDLLLDKQELPEIEVIALDCGVSEEVLRAVSEYVNADKRVLLVRPPRAANVSDCLNAGLRAAHASYIYIYDFCRSELHPWTLHDAWQTASRDEADLCVFKSEEIDRETGAYRSLLEERETLFPAERPFSVKDFVRNPFEAVSGWPGDKLFRREFLQEHEIFFAETGEKGDKKTAARLRDADFVLTALIRAERVSLDSRAPVVRMPEDDAEGPDEESLPLPPLPELEEAVSKLRARDFDAELSLYLSAALQFALSSFRTSKLSRELSALLCAWGSPSAEESSARRTREARENSVVFRYNAPEGELAGAPLFSLSAEDEPGGSIFAEVDFLFFSGDGAEKRDTLYLSCVNARGPAGNTALSVRRAEWEYGERPFETGVAYSVTKNILTIYAKYAGKHTGMAYHVRVLTSVSAPPVFTDLATERAIEYKSPLPADAIFVTDRLLSLAGGRAPSNIGGRVVFECDLPQDAAEGERYGAALFFVDVGGYLGNNAAAVIDFVFMDGDRPFVADTLILGLSFRKEDGGENRLRVFQAEWDMESEPFVSHILCAAEGSVLTLYTAYTGARTGVAFHVRSADALQEKLPAVRAAAKAEGPLKEAEKLPRNCKLLCAE
jgi:glycosyltransferase involved in cell wall biosynthesis